MNADLEETLNELGPEYRRVVDRLRGAAEVEIRGATLPVGRRGAFVPGRGLLPLLQPTLLAASLLLALSLSVVFLTSPRRHAPNVRLAICQGYGAREYRMAPAEIIATQRSDGSWANDFLTRRNAEALKGIDDPRAKVAYKKAMRNLRLRQAL